ncbi:glycosyltransferase family 2 protein [Candidatus Falkowbacteria bacterium]|nr:glycosyltransferase family 2 protein [Candidatus Falkowbacteria bacterium]NCT54965.1 glycosyltransferase family 2 protein [Candidatus Falkowbacteria bacterium]
MYNKIIVLLPVKNEAHVLDFYLKNASFFCDHIIIADQMSTDDSREIYKKYPKTIVIDNKREGHSNEVRWDLLKEARKLGDNNLLIALDADEYIPNDLFKKFLNTEDFSIGNSFSFPWIQVWRNPEIYNVSKDWKDDYKAIAWVDDGKSDYEKIKVINDHTNRIPEPFLNKTKKIDYTPNIHLAFLFWKRQEIKRVWYKCTELIAGKRSARRINEAYYLILDKNNKKLASVKKEWIKGYKDDLLALQKSENDKTKLKEIYNFFDTYTIEFFEPLEIWHLEELENEFIKRTRRKPITKTYPQWFIAIIKLRRKVKKIIKPNRIW